MDEQIKTDFCGNQSNKRDTIYHLMKSWKVIPLDNTYGARVKSDVHRRREMCFANEKIETWRESSGFTEWFLRSDVW